MFVAWARFSFDVFQHCHRHYEHVFTARKYLIEAEDKITRTITIVVLVLIFAVRSLRLPCCSTIIPEVDLDLSCCATTQILNCCCISVLSGGVRHLEYKPKTP